MFTTSFCLLVANLKSRTPKSSSGKTQSGDIKNHLGSRAHIEIIDHGDGYFELDEIRFSDGAKPVDGPTGVLSELAKSDFSDLKGFSHSLSRSIAKQLDGGKEGDASPIASWIVESELDPVVAPGDSSKTSSRRVGNTRNVSFRSGVGNRSARDLASKLTSLRRDVAKLNEATPKPRFAIGMTEGTGEEEKIFIRGNHKTLGKVATRRFLEALSDRPLNPPDGSGRDQLAHKITAPNNPLTMRVAVNRVWHHLFGRGIVESVDNFWCAGKTANASAVTGLFGE